MVFYYETARCQLNKNIDVLQNYEIFTISDAVCWETNLNPPPPPFQSDAVRICKSKGSLTAEQQKSGQNQLWWFVENICWIMYTWQNKKCWNKQNLIVNYCELNA